MELSGAATEWHSVSAEEAMRRAFFGLSLFTDYGNRKYLNAAERSRFIAAARCGAPETGLFCQTLGWTGARISEVLALTPAAFDLDYGVCIETLKRRESGNFRQVPLPPKLLKQLDLCFGLSTAQKDIERTTRRIWDVEPHHRLAAR
jgi:integrase/recombinase XerD